MIAALCNFLFINVHNSMYLHLYMYVCVKYKNNDYIYPRVKLFEVSAAQFFFC